MKQDALIGHFEVFAIDVHAISPEHDLLMLQHHACNVTRLRCCSAGI